MPAPSAKRLSHSIVYNGRVFRIERDMIMLPHGRTATMEVVRHRGSVVLVPQPDRKHVILIRQYRYAIDRWIWELPAGSLEAGEPASRAARRECAEEIGLEPRRVTRLSTSYPTPGFCDELMTFYRCEGLRAPRGHVERDPDEQIEPQTFSLADVRRMIDRGRIVDMKTVVGISLIDR
jgi:ADP-ribose pyrophosphatase